MYVYMCSIYVSFVFLAREIDYITNFQTNERYVHFSFMPYSFPGADDNTLFQKFERQQKNHPHYRSPQLKQQDPQFTILHYASEVTYSVKVRTLCTVNTEQYIILYSTCTKAALLWIYVGLIY
jgi:hypothetical protein